jgi:hypothetical protein
MCSFEQELVLAMLRKRLQTLKTARTKGSYAKYLALLRQAKMFEADLKRREGEPQTHSCELFKKLVLDNFNSDKGDDK